MLQIEIGSAACNGLWHGPSPPPVLAPFAVAAARSRWKAMRIAVENAVLFEYNKIKNKAVPPPSYLPETN